LYKATEGVVDVASGPLFDIWGFGFSSGELPDDQTVASVKESAGMSRLKASVADASAQDGTISASSLLLEESGALPKLNFNAVAQGYSCDVVADYLYSIGVKDMLVDIGEFFCDGLNPSGKPWSIGIDRPFDGNNQPGASLQGVFRAPAGPHGIVTSGNYRKFYVRDGKKYAHTVDPRTGYPVQHSLLSATVVASDAFLADAYATWCMVVGLDEAKRFLDHTHGFEGCLIYDDNGQMKTWCSAGFSLEEM
jgi:thiamine biosynthesis lipoprotein